MRSLVVAKKDFNDAIRSWEMWGLIVIFTGITAGLFYAINESSALATFWPQYLEFFGGASLGISTVEFVGFYVGIAEAFLPVVALLITHKAVAGEIESGSVKFLISAPLTRFDAFIGKIIGRTAVLWSALAVGFVVSIGVIMYIGGEFTPIPYAIAMALTALFVLSYVAIGVALSALAKSNSRATLYAISFFIGVGMLIHLANNGVHWLIKGDPLPNPAQGQIGGPPDVGGWYFLIPRLSPGRAYRQAVNAYVAGEPFGYEPVFEELPFYLTDWAAVGILILWTAVGIGVGYWSFQRTDIN